MKVIYVQPPGRGWATIALLSRLTAELLEAELSVVPLRPGPGVLRRASVLVPRRRGGEDCLVIAPVPGALNALASFDHLLRGHRQVAGWVIDSFWHERIPAIARTRGRFDQFFVTDSDDVEPWRRATGRPTTSVPIGTDVLAMGPLPTDRPVDVLRFGRQPEEWSDDAVVAEACRATGIAFAGRPPHDDDPARNQREAIAAFGATKFTLSFSPTQSPADYTHPTRDYLTGRWTDAIAAGAIVAGIAPRCGSASELLWPGATLELGSTERAAGIRVLRDAIDEWTPERAATNRTMALQRFDLRWRIAAVAEAMGVTSGRLDAEIGRLQTAIGAAAAPSA